MFSPYENPPGDGSLHGGSKQFIDVRCNEDSTCGHPVQGGEPRILQALGLAKTAGQALTQYFLSPASKLPDWDVRSLYKKGVSLDALDPIVGPPLVAKAEVRLKSSRWEPFPLGVPALLFIETQANRAIDIIAFDGAKSAMLTGRAPILGFEAVLGWSDHLKPLRVYTDPVEWLANDCVGIVIIDHSRAWRLLWWVDHFEVSNAQEAVRLRDALKAPTREVQISICSDGGVA